MLKVLIVDDQPAVRAALETLFELNDLPAVAVSAPEEALNLLATEDIGAVVQDMNFTQEQTSGAEGTRLYRAIRELDPDMPVLLMTAWSSLESAVLLIKEGASDYIAKPWDNDKLLRTVKNLVNLRALRQENTRLRAQGNRSRRALARKADLRDVIYASPADARGWCAGGQHRPVGRAGADHRTQRIGQGETGRDHPVQQPAQGQAVREGERGAPAREPVRGRAVRGRGGRLHRGSKLRWGGFESADGGHAVPRLSWGRCRWPPRPSCCGCCRPGSSSGWARRSRARRTCA
jgi:FixJ family two-component response regulator